MKVVYSQLQFKKSVEIVSGGIGKQYSDVSQILHSLVNALVSSEETMTVSSGFFLIKDSDPSEDIVYVQIFVDTCFNEKDLDFVEFEMKEKVFN